MNTIGSIKVWNLFFEKTKNDYNLFKCYVKFISLEKETRIHYITYIALFLSTKYVLLSR